MSRHHQFCIYFWIFQFFCTHYQSWTSVVYTRASPVAFARTHAIGLPTVVELHENCGLCQQEIQMFAVWVVALWPPVVIGRLSVGGQSWCSARSVNPATSSTRLRYRQHAWTPLIITPRAQSVGRHYPSTTLRQHDAGTTRLDAPARRGQLQASARRPQLGRGAAPTIHDHTRLSTAAATGWRHHAQQLSRRSPATAVQVQSASVFYCQRVRQTLSCLVYSHSEWLNAIQGGPKT